MISKSYITRIVNFELKIKNYIDLHRENCNMGDDAFDTNFLLQSWHNSGHEYDFNSIMHYKSELKNRTIFWFRIFLTLLFS